MTAVVLKPGHVRPLWAGHPWVYAQGIARTLGDPQSGSEVKVLDPKGHVLGRGLFSQRSAIAVRLYTRQPELPFDATLLRQRVQRALQRRRDLGFMRDDTTGYRVVNAEGDGLPGLVVDRFGDVVVLQLSTYGLHQRAKRVVQAIQDELQPRSIVDRTGPELARLEGFDVEPGVVAGDPEVSELSFLEHGMRFDVPLDMAQKTGFYLDLRALRSRLEQLAAGRRVLDCYSYVGAAGLRMARGGALEVLSVDKSARAVEVAGEIARRNQLGSVYRAERADAFRALEAAREMGGYDLVLCDPPKLAPRRSAQKKARALLERLASVASGATRPGGLLVLCSCSHALGANELTRALALGARAAEREARVVERIFQDVDHPVLAAFPEGLYLSSVIASIE